MNTVYGYLKVSTGTAAEKISVNLVERYLGVEVDVVLLQPDLFREKPRHELPEQLAHNFHTLGASRHILGGVSHSEKHRFDATGARRIVQLRIAVGYTELTQTKAV